MSGRWARRAAVLLLAVAVSSGGAPAVAQSSSQTLKVAIGASGLYFLTHFVAEGGGFFKQEGLELDTIDVTSGPRQVAAVMGGSVDIAPLGLQLVIQATSRGGNIVAISAGYNILPMALVLSNDAVAKVGITDAMSTDEKIKRIKGLRIGITAPGSGTDDMARTLTTLRGVDPDKDIKILPLGNGDSMLAALQQGLTDGFVFTSPFPETVVARKLGQLLLASDYIATLSPFAIAHQLAAQRLTALAFRLPLLRRAIGITYRQHPGIPPAAKSLVRHIEWVSRSLERPANETHSRTGAS